MPKLSVPEGARGLTLVGSSGQEVETPRLIMLPQMPCVVDAPTRKHKPRHWMFLGVVSPGTVTVTLGLQGAPLGRRDVTGPVESQSPV